MILTIDNLDGNGAIDYNASLCADMPLTIERVLNMPSRCAGTLDVGSSANPGASSALLVPVRRGRVVVSSDSGAVLFTGYLATEPVPVYVGTGLAGPVYRVAFTAISDEWLLDKQSLTLTADGFTVPAGSLLQTLTARTAAGRFTTSQVQSGKPIGVFTPEPAKPWSSNAGNIAGSTYAAYRVLNGALAMQPVGTVTHALDFDAGQGDGTLQVAALKTSMVKELANDVTLSGAIEPTAYVAEIFAGDGTTTLFTLSGKPYRVGKPLLLSDSFNQPAFNTQLWNLTDPGSHLSLGGAGLVLSGGNGFDGQTTLVAIDQVEMGGSLVVEAGNLQLTSPSDGVLCGLYSGSIQRANCFAGYNVRQSSGSTVVTPYVNGAEVGTTYTLLSGIMGEMSEYLASHGVPVVRAHLPFDPIRAHRAAEGLLGQDFSLISNALRIFCGSMSLCVQAVLMASDAGYVSFAEHVIAMTSDTSIIARAATTSRFLTDLIVREIICKPLLLTIGKGEKPIEVIEETTKAQDAIADSSKTLDLIATTEPAE